MFDRFINLISTCTSKCFGIRNIHVVSLLNVDVQYKHNILYADIIIFNNSHTCIKFLLSYIMQKFKSIYIYIVTLCAIVIVF